MVIDRRTFFGLAAAVPMAVSARAEEWVDLFDGRSLNGWRPSENKDSWKIVNGHLTANGPRSHLFYTGPVRAGDFRNFELEVDLITQPECNSGIYFHTAYQESGFPEKGFEIQINNTARGDGGYLERKKTASLYGIRNMYKQLVPDEKPFQIHVSVRGKTVHIRLNNQLLVDYVEPTPPVIPEGGEKMRFSTMAPSPCSATTMAPGWLTQGCGSGRWQMTCRLIRELSPPSMRHIARSSMSDVTTFPWSISTFSFETA